MNNIEKDVNSLIMREIGLEVGQAYKIYDQDTGMPIEIGNNSVVASECLKGRQMLEFDPYNNSKMMKHLFYHFINKYQEETGREPVVVSDIPSDNIDKGSIKCIFDDNEVIQSGDYNRYSLRLADVIIQLNGGEKNSLKDFDLPMEMPKKSVKKSSAGGAKGGKKKD